MCGTGGPSGDDQGVHIVIIGAGEIGFYLAERLHSERHDIVVIEADPSRAAAIADSLDVQVVVGSGTSPSDLAAARIDGARMLAAVTDNDEVNLLACLLAKQAGVPATVVRIQSQELQDEPGATLRETLGVDVVIDPDRDTADEIIELVSLPGADEVYPMAGGDLTLIGAAVSDGAPIAGRTLADIAASGEGFPFLFGAITRDGRTTIPRGGQTIEAGDHVRVITRDGDRARLFRLLGLESNRARRVMVLGGGAIGSRVADRLQRSGVGVTLVERDLDRARALAEAMPRVTVVRGDITDTDLLAEENVGSTDAVVAATGEDAANVLSCAYAAAEGSRFTVAVLHRLDLLPLVRRFGIDASLSPRTASANAVLGHARGELVQVVATFLESDAEVDEIEVAEGAVAVGARLADLDLPMEFLIGAVIGADGKGVIARGATELRAGDHVIVFARPDALAEARGLFG